MNASRATSVVTTALAASFMVFVLASSSAVASPGPSPASTPIATSHYGALRTISVGPVHTGDGWTYQGNETVGYTVTIYDNATSATTYELTIFRTMGIAYSVSFCMGGCSSPTEWANESFRAWETTASFTNFTNQSTVLENGTSNAAAVAIQNSTVFVRANLNETSDVYLPGAGQLGPHTRYLNASLDAVAAVDFAPALGLFPTTLYSGSTWSSSSAFNLTGSASYTYYYAAHSPILNNVVGPISGSFSVDANGTVSLAGAYPEGSTFTYNGVTYPAIILVVTGPFSVRDGVVFVPAAADLFGSTSHPWGTYQAGSASAQASNLDVQTGAGGRADIFASKWQYSSATTNAAQMTDAGASETGLTPAASTADPIGTSTLQGEPQTTEQANDAQNCLTSGTGCPPVPPNTSSPSRLFGDIVLVGAIATVGSIVALAVVTRRRTVPPPLYPNAGLYPPGAASPPGTARAPSSPESPAPSEDDPLDHLW